MNTMDETDPKYTKIMSYIEAHPSAILGTVNEDGTPHGAAIYVVVASHHTVCFVTKTLTTKFKNLTRQSQVSLTFVDDHDSSTLQVRGRAYSVEDTKMQQYIMDKMVKIHRIQADWLPPIAKLEAGPYTVVGVELQDARLAEYQGVDISGNEQIFTELQ